MGSHTATFWDTTRDKKRTVMSLKFLVIVYCQKKCGNQSLPPNTEFRKMKHKITSVLAPDSTFISNVRKGHQVQ